MKIVINQAKLSKYLSYTSRAVSQKPNIPILSNVLLKVDKNHLNLSATNLEMGINMWIPGQVETEGSTTVSAKYLADFVTASNSDKVVIEQKENVINVKTEKAKANFNTIPSSEFPVLPKSQEKSLFVISSKELSSALEKVLFSCSLDLSAGKIQQSGVLFEFDSEDSEKINFIGLDGFRLSKKTSKISERALNVPTDQLIVPAKYLQEIIKIIADLEESEDIEVFLSENQSQIIFKFEEVEFSIRLIEGPYPDYKRIIPDSASFVFEVKKSDLEEAIKVANTFARSNLGNKTLFDLDVENAVVKLRSNVSEVGENEAAFTVSSLNAESDLNTAYNLKFISDVVAHIKSDTVRFETKGALAASVFKDKNDSGYLHLLMPLRREV